MISTRLPRIPYADAARNLLRESALDAVDELVRRNGWAATSIANVAELVGVSRQTLYKEFGSRQSIAEAYGGHRLDQLLSAVTDTVRTYADDVEVGFRLALGMFFDMVDEPLIQTVLSSRSTSAELIPLIRTFNERATEHLAALFRELNPDVSDYDAVVFADSIARIGAAHAVAPTLPREVAIDRMVRLIVVVLGANQPSLA